MKAGAGRIKGSSFERKVAKIIVTAFRMKKEDCYRTPGSGGHRYASKKDPGDLVLSPRLKKRFPFSVECKFYAKLDWGVLLSSKKQKGQFASWWAQCMRSAVKGTLPLLVFKQNRGEVWAMYRAGALSELEEGSLGAFQPDTYIRTRLALTTVRIVRFADLIEWIREE